MNKNKNEDSNSKSSSNTSPTPIIRTYSSGNTSISVDLSVLREISSSDYRALKDLSSQLDYYQMTMNNIANEMANEASSVLGEWQGNWAGAFYGHMSGYKASSLDNLTYLIADVHDAFFSFFDKEKLFNLEPQSDEGTIYRKIKDYAVEIADKKACIDKMLDDYEAGISA